MLAVGQAAFSATPLPAGKKHAFSPAPAPTEGSALRVLPGAAWLSSAQSVLKHTCQPQGTAFQPALIRKKGSLRSLSVSLLHLSSRLSGDMALLIMRNKTSY